MIRTSLCALLPWIGASALPHAPDRPHVRKLSGPLPVAHAGAVWDHVVAPGGRWIVYRADATVDERLELYAVPADGSAAPRALCGPLATDVDVQEYRVAPDGESVVYTLDRGFDGGRSQLWSARLDGVAPPVRLTEPLRSWAAVDSGLQISPDSTRVVFTGDLLVDARRELFSVSLDGSAPPVKLDPLVGNGAIHGALVSRDSRRVVFRMSPDGLELYSVPIEGGPVTRLSGTSVPLGGVLDFRLAGERVVYLADPVVNDRFELYSVPIDGSAPPIPLTAASASGGNVDFGIEIDTAGRRAVYRVRAPSTSSVELHSVPVDGSASDVRLDAYGGVFGALRFTSSRVLFLGRPTLGPASNALFSAPLDGGAPAVQLGRAPSNASVTAFQPSADGLRVAFVRATASLQDLLATACDGSAPEVKLDLAPFDVVAVDNLRVGASRAAYVARRTSGGRPELYSAPLDGSALPLRLLEALPPLHDLAPDIELSGSSVLHRADWSEDGVIELLSVPLDGSAPFVSLSGPGALTTVGDVQRFAVAGRRVVYLADEVTDGVDELFSADLDRGGAARRLNDPLGPGGGVGGFVLTSDGRAVVYRARRTDRYELFVAPSDGRTRAKKLDGLATQFGGVERDFRLSADGRWVVYVSNERGNSQKDLFVVPSDGSAPARSLLTFSSSFRADDYLLALSPDSGRAAFCPYTASEAGRDLYSAALDDPSAGVAHLSLPNYLSGTLTALDVSADSRRAVFRADAVTDERYLLYSWPLDGSAGLTALIPPRSGGALDFAVPAGGERVVFRVYLPDRIELSSAPVDGRAPPTALAALAPGRAVLEFALSPDGTRALYRADAETDDRYELFSVPVDGSAPPVKLSYASRRDTDVSAFAFTPDSRLVLFLADTLRNEQDDLYVVPADRSAPPRRLNPSLAPHGTLFDFRCSPDCGFVAYRANHRDQAVAELFRVPITGGVEPELLSAPLVANGDVRAYAFASADELVYDADQDEDEAFELFASALGELRRPSAPPAPLR